MYPREPENVDSIGREIAIGPISDYIGITSNLLNFSSPSMNPVMFVCSLVHMCALKLRLATKSQCLCLCLFTSASQHVFPAMPPNGWKNEAMWLQGHIDDWFDRGGRTIVKLPEEGRDPPDHFYFLFQRVGSVPSVSVALHFAVQAATVIGLRTALHFST